MCEVPKVDVDTLINVDKILYFSAMAAPLGNQFWKLRSKHGRDKLFATPELMQEAAEEYFQWCVENPVFEADIRACDKELHDVEIPKVRAFTLQGLCSYLNCNTVYFRNFKIQERAQKEDFSAIINWIEETIYNQKFTYAAVGLMKENLIARDLGLSDKQQTDTSMNIIFRPNSNL